MTSDSRQQANQSDLASLTLIGAASIDKEHLALFAQLDRLHGNPSAHPDTEAFLEVFSRLGRQISAHFDSEEGILKACGMPPDQIAAHVQAHDEILEQYAQLNLDLMEGKKLTRSEALLTIKRWIIDHVVYHDTRIRAYLPGLT